MQKFHLIDLPSIFQAMSMFTKNKQKMSVINECLPSTSKANKECIPSSPNKVSALPYYQLNGREPPPPSLYRYLDHIAPYKCSSTSKLAKTLKLSIFK